MSRSVFVLALSIQVTLIGCSSVIDPESASAQLKDLTTQCVGQIRGGQLLIFQPGSTATHQPDKLATGLEFGKYSRFGNKIVGWNQDGLFLVSSDGRVPLKDLELDAPTVDLSSDGRFVALTGTDRRAGKTGVLLIDESHQLVTHVSSRAEALAVSPSGSSLAFESAGQVRIVGEMESLTKALPAESRLPSWSSNGDSLSLLSGGGFHIFRRDGAVARVVPVRGTPLGPMLWSANDRAGMYVTRNASEYWSGPSCTDGFWIVIVNLETGIGFDFHQGCASYAERTQWLPPGACSG
jgi:hypothetical protein